MSNAKVQDLMTGSVVTTEQHKTVEHVRKMMERSKVGAVPIVNSDGEPIGIVSVRDFVSGLKDGSPVSSIMTAKVYSVPQYEDVSTAARIMRNHKIHRLVVTHEQKVVGVISSFDLLALVEDHRFAIKNAPSQSKRKGSKKA